MRKNLYNPEYNKETMSRKMFRRWLKHLVWVLSKPDFIGDAPPFIPKVVYISLIKISLALPTKITEYMNKVLDKAIIGLGFRWVKEVLPAKYFKSFSIINFYGLDLKVPTKVEKYLEKLQSEWIAVEPSVWQGDDKGPAALKMNVIRLYSLEKID